MNLAGLSTAAKILLIAGLLLFIDLFLAWQQACASGNGFSVCGSLSGWHGVGVVTGLLVIALLVWEGAQLAGVTANLAVPVALISAALAGGVALFAIIEFFTHDEARHWPAWIGLILGIVIAVGGWLRLQTGPEAPITGHTTQSPPPAV
jgi:hypothetical protein